mgnify:CR=1 FL=1
MIHETLDGEVIVVNLDTGVYITGVLTAGVFADGKVDFLQVRRD